MIVSHQYKFIFIKTFRTAGTAVEISLARYCGPNDILTPIRPAEEFNRRHLGIYPRNYATWPFSLMLGERVNIHKSDNPDPRFFTLMDKFRRRKFTEHMAARAIVKELGSDIWDSYTKFAIERDPLERMASQYYWELYTGACENLNGFFANLPAKSNFDLYAVQGVPVADRILRYNHLEEDLTALCHSLDIPYDGWLPKVKSGIRRKRLEWQELFSEEQVRKIVNHCAHEYQILMEYGEEPPEEVASMLTGVAPLRRAPARIADVKPAPVHQEEPDIDAAPGQDDDLDTDDKLEIFAEASTGQADEPVTSPWEKDISLPTGPASPAAEPGAFEIKAPKKDESEEDAEKPAWPPVSQPSSVDMPRLRRPRPVMPREPSEKPEKPEREKPRRVPERLRRWAAEAGPFGRREDEEAARAKKAGGEAQDDGVRNQIRTREKTEEIPVPVTGEETYDENDPRKDIAKILGQQFGAFRSPLSAKDERSGAEDEPEEGEVLEAAPQAFEDDLPREEPESAPEIVAEAEPVPEPAPESDEQDHEAVVIESAPRAEDDLTEDEAGEEPPAEDAQTEEALVEAIAAELASADEDTGEEKHTGEEQPPAPVLPPAPWRRRTETSEQESRPEPVAPRLRMPEPLPAQDRGEQPDDVDDDGELKPPFPVAQDNAESAEPMSPTQALAMKLGAAAPEPEAKVTYEKTEFQEEPSEPEAALEEDEAPDWLDDVDEDDWLPPEEEDAPVEASVRAEVVAGALDSEDDDTAPADEVQIAPSMPDEPGEAEEPDEDDAATDDDAVIAPPVVDLEPETPETSPEPQQALSPEPEPAFPEEPEAEVEEMLDPPLPEPAPAAPAAELRGDLEGPAEADPAEPSNEEAPAQEEQVEEPIPESPSVAVQDEETSRDYEDEWTQAAAEAESLIEEIRKAALEEEAEAGTTQSMEAAPWEPEPLPEEEDDPEPLPPPMPSKLMEEHEEPEPPPMPGPADAEPVPPPMPEPVAETPAGATPLFPQAEAAPVWPRPADYDEIPERKSPLGLWVEDTPDAEEPAQDGPSAEADQSAPPSPLFPDVPFIPEKADEPAVEPQLEKAEEPAAALEPEELDEPELEPPMPVEPVAPPHREIPRRQSSLGGMPPWLTGGPASQPSSKQPVERRDTTTDDAQSAAPEAAEAPPMPEPVKPAPAPQPVKAAPVDGALDEDALDKALADVRANLAASAPPAPKPEPKAEPEPAKPEESPGHGLLTPGRFGRRKSGWAFVIPDTEKKD